MMSHTKFVDNAAKFKRRIIQSFAIFAVLLPLNLQSAPKDPNLSEGFLGNPKAKVVLVEYGSLVCGHCADLAINVMPKIKAKYVDTGKVKFVYRAFPTQPAALAIGLQVIADCAGPVKRYDIIDEFYRKQEMLFSASESVNGVLKLALKLAQDRTGLSGEKAKACLQNDQMISHIGEVAQWGDAKYNISGTPFLIINGKDIDPTNTNQYSVEFISSQLDKALTPKPSKGKKP